MVLFHVGGPLLSLVSSNGLSDEHKTRITLAPLPDPPIDKVGVRRHLTQLFQCKRLSFTFHSASTLKLLKPVSSSFARFESYWYSAEPNSISSISDCVR